MWLSDEQLSRLNSTFLVHVCVSERLSVCVQRRLSVFLQLLGSSKASHSFHSAQSGLRSRLLIGKVNIKQIRHMYYKQTHTHTQNLDPCTVICVLLCLPHFINGYR